MPDDRMTGGGTDGRTAADVMTAAPYVLTLQHDHRGRTDLPGCGLWRGAGPG